MSTQPCPGSRTPADLKAGKTRELPPAEPVFVTEYPCPDCGQMVQAMSGGLMWHLPPDS